jgi:hypothetical protein
MNADLIQRRRAPDSARALPDALLTMRERE